MNVSHACTDYRKRDTHNPGVVVKHINALIADYGGNRVVGCTDRRSVRNVYLSDVQLSLGSREKIGERLSFFGGATGGDDNIGRVLH